MVLKISPLRAKRISIAAASCCTGLASLVTMVPDGLLQVAITAGTGIAGATAIAAGVICAVKTHLANRHPPVSTIELAQETDIPSLRHMAVSYFGDKVTPLERMKQWHAKNPTIFSTVTTEIRRGKRRIVDLDGYYCVVPLGEAATADVAAERMGINDLGEHQVCHAGEVPSGLYVGAIAAGNEATRSAAMQGLRGAIKRMARNRRDTLIMTRPVTHDGLRWVRAFGLQPVRPGVEDPIGVLHMTRLGDLAQFNRRQRQ